MRFFVEYQCKRCGVTATSGCSAEMEIIENAQFASLAEHVRSSCAPYPMSIWHKCFDGEAGPQYGVAEFVGVHPDPGSNDDGSDLQD